MANIGFNEVGNTYGLWKVLSEESKPKHRKGRGRYFLCECQCKQKTIKILNGNALRQGRTTCCGCIKIRNKKAPVNYLMGLYKKSAKKRRKCFNLTYEDVEYLVQQNCYYCGQKPECKLKNLKHHDFKYNGIDRVNNDQGYILTNCVPCCKVCNTAKLDMSLEEFIDWIKRIHTYLAFKS